MFEIIRTGFGSYPEEDWKTAESISGRVFDILSRHSGVPSRGLVVITHAKGDSPMCMNPTPENIEALRRDGIRIPEHPAPRRVISLQSEPVRWCQWIYQLAHEACHHLIDGKMLCGLAGLQWLEETLCEAASLFCLAVTSNPTIWGEMDCYQYAPCAQSYLDSHLQSLFPLREEYYRMNNMEQSQGIRPWLDILGEKSTQGISESQRTLCNAVASLILPAFLRNPRLWEIIAHIGDSARWQTLEALFAHLKSELSSELHAEISGLRRILLG